MKKNEDVDGVVYFFHARKVDSNLCSSGSYRITNVDVTSVYKVVHKQVAEEMGLPMSEVYLVSLNRL